MYTLCAGDAVRHRVTVHTLCAGAAVRQGLLCTHCVLVMP